MGFTIQPPVADNWSQIAAEKIVAAISGAFRGSTAVCREGRGVADNGLQQGTGTPARKLLGLTDTMFCRDFLLNRPHAFNLIRQTDFVRQLDRERF